MTARKGIFYGIGAYLMWGFFPVYFKALQNTPPLQILFHRVVWSFIFLGLILSLRRDWKNLQSAVVQPRALLIYVVAGMLLATNWLVYIYGVNSGQVVETSLGYFINPLISVALGVIFLRERLRPLQWVPVGMAAVGVIYLALQVGRIPWIALALAFSFGLYGLIKKTAPLGSLYGLTLETGAIFLPGILFLLYAESQGTGTFGHAGWWTSILLALSGVITAIPLLLFAKAARSIPLWMVGILQYIAPTCQFLLGVLLYHEPFTLDQMVGFGLIWLALLVFSAENLLIRRKTQHIGTATAST
jgi:chloramphenicol-sensitive protein RarD